MENNQEAQRGRFERRFSEQEQGINPGNAAIITALGAAGIALGMRSGGFNRASRFFSEEGRSVYRAAKEVIDTADPLRRFNSKGLDNQLKDFETEFKNRSIAFKKAYREHLSENKRLNSQKGLLMNRDRDVSVWLRNINEMTGNTKQTKVSQRGKIENSYEDQFRHERIIKRLNESKHKAVEPNKDHMIAAVNEMNSFLLGNTRSKALVNKHFKERNFTNQQAIDEFRKIQREINQELRSDKGKEAIQTFAKATNERIKKEAIDQIVETESLRQGALQKARRNIEGRKELTVSDVLRLHKQKKVEVDQETLDNMNEALKINRKFGNVVYDSKMYLRKDKVEDSNIFRDMRHSVMDWYADSMPGGLLQFRTKLEMEKARKYNSFHIFERGSRQPTLSGYLGGGGEDILGTHYVNLKGKVFHLTDTNKALEPNTKLNPINENNRIYLMSAEYGPIGKMMRRMGGIQTKYKERNAVTEFLDLGNQDKDNFLRENVSRFTKFFDPKWDRRWLKELPEKGVKSADEVFELQAYLSLNTLGMTPRVFKNLKGEMDDTLTLVGVDNKTFNFTKDEDRIDLFNKLGEHISSKDPGKLTSAEEGLLKKFNKYTQNPDSFMMRSTPISQPDLILGTATRMRTGLDEIDQSVSNYMLDNIISKRMVKNQNVSYYSEAEKLRSEMLDIVKEGNLTQRDRQHFEESLNYSVFSRKFNEAHGDDTNLVNNINEMIQNTPALNESLIKMGRRTNSLFESHGFKVPENLIGDKLVAVNEARGFGAIKNGITSTHMSVHDRLKEVASPFTQFFAGRKNMEDVTTATMGGYYMVHRLEQMISSMGLGFSDNSMSSTMSIMTNLVGKRLLPPLLGYETFKYGDYLWDTISGSGFTERYENMKADQMLDKVANMSAQEKYEQQRARQLKPGLEHLAAAPAFSMPIAGRVGLGEMANRLLFSNPVLGDYVDLDERTDMTYEDALEDLYFGVEEVRKGRWWAIGSTTAYRGGRVDYFKPNSFRMAHSDWEDAGVGLTRKEYWQNHFLPNFHNPLGGLAFVVGMRDPYHFENKHYEDRPFLLTGELFNPNSLLFGDIGNMTIGRMVKPVREMHEEYWSEPFLQTAGQSPLGETPPAPVSHAYKLSPGAGLMAEGTSYAGLPEPPTYQEPPKYGPRKLEEKLNEVALLGTPKLTSEATGENSANWMKRAIARSNKLDNEGAETGQFIIHDMSSGKSVYVPTRVSMDEKTTYEDLINEAYEVEPEKFLASSRMGTAIKGISDIMGIHSPMSGLFATAPMEMIAGNSYVEMMNHRDTMRAIEYDIAADNSMQMYTEQMAQQVGGVIDTTEYSPRAREALEQGLIRADVAPHSGWIDTTTVPRMREEINPIDPRSAGWKAQEFIENWTEPLGVYKWMFNDEMLSYNPYQGKAVIQQADYAYSLSAKFWESNIGSLGGAFSEFARRFMRPYDGQVEYFNPIRNTMPEWMPGNSYMIDFKSGDPYSKIDGGEYRLPGGAYERLNELHSDHFGRYGAFDRFKILADVAPWSDEYEMWSDYVQEYVVDEKLKKQAEQIRKQAGIRKTKYEFEEYKFKDNDVTWAEAKISTFIDDYRFMINGSDEIYTLAGVNTRPAAEGVMAQYFKPGDVVRIGIAKDENRQRKDDTNNTIGAVVQNAIGNVNRDIIQRGLMKESMNDFSAAGVQARFSDKEIRQGKSWETMAHYPSIFNTKFMPVRSAVEEYERDQIYGKDWATWEGFLFDDYIKPLYEGFGRYTESHGLIVGTGMNVGHALAGSWVVGSLFLPQKGRKALIVGSAAFSGIKGVANYIHTSVTGRSNLPERREREAEINEYYDVLKYMKYEGMYQKSREEILHRSGIDVEQVFTDLKGLQEELKIKQKTMEKERKKLFKSHQDEERVYDSTKERTMKYDFEKGELIKLDPQKKPYWERRRKQLNAEINGLKDRLPRVVLSPDIQQALEYRQQRDQTIFNLDLSQTNGDLAKAFPHKDRYFFEAFSKATDKEKKRLRQILPEYQLQAYERIWAGERDANPADYRKSLDYYEKKYGLPDWRWAGWRPDVSLDDIKMQTVAAEGLDLTDFGFWEADLERAAQAPSLGSDGSNSIEADKLFSGFSKFRKNMQSILEGAGLWDVNVTVVPVDKRMTNVTILYEQDRTQEVQAGLQREMYNTY